MTATSTKQPKIVQQFFNEEYFEGTLEELLAALEGQEDSPLTDTPQRDSAGVVSPGAANEQRRRHPPTGDSFTI